MKVYFVIHDLGYEGDIHLQCFSTQEKAEKWVQTAEKKIRMGKLVIEEWEIIEKWEVQ